MEAAELLLPTRTRVQLGPLLAVAAPSAVLALALGLAAPALVTQDSWLALVSGREIAAHGLPTVDHLTAMASGRHWVDQQWLAQLLLDAAAQIGGVGAAFALSVLATLVAFVLALHVAYRRGASPVAIALFLPLAVAAAPWGAQLRTQSFALPLFSLVLWLLARDPRAERSSTLLVLPALVVWANVHGSVVIGAGLAVAYALQALARPVGRAARTRAAACLVLAPAAVLASPYALELPGYYRTMLLDPPFGRYVSEWGRTTPSPLTAAFFALATLAVALVVVRRGRLGAFDHLALALTLVVGIDAIRGIVWFGLASLALLPALATARPGTERLDGRSAARFVLAALAVIGAALAWSAARPAQAYEAQVPPRLLDVVRAHSAAGETVFANEATADWLLWELPSLRGRLAYDVRFELMTRAQVRRLLAWRRFAPGWETAADGYGIVVDDPQHVSRLVATGRWRRLLAGAQIAVAERR